MPTQDAQHPQDDMPKGRKGKAAPWNSETASQAAKARWAKQREREAEAESAAEAPLLTAEERIVAKLRSKAEGGDVAAARELREWMALQVDTRPIDVFALLTRPQRAQVRAWLEENACKYADSGEDGRRLSSPSASGGPAPSG